MPSSESFIGSLNIEKIISGCAVRRRGIRHEPAPVFPPACTISLPTKTISESPHRRYQIHDLALLEHDAMPVSFPALYTGVTIHDAVIVSCPDWRKLNDSIYRHLARKWAALLQSISIPVIDLRNHGAAACMRASVKNESRNLELFAAGAGQGQEARMQIERVKFRVKKGAPRSIVWFGS